MTDRLDELSVDGTNCIQYYDTQRLALNTAGTPHNP